MSDILQLQGKLRLKAADRTKWLRTEVEPADAARYGDAGFGTFDEAQVARGTVKEVLDAMMRDRNLRVRLTYARSPVVVQGLIPASAVAFYWPALVGMCEAAGERGGKGELSLTHKRSQNTMRVRLDGEGGVSLETANLRREAAEAAGPVRLPGIIERAKSGRASCRACRRPIEAGAFRFGAMDVVKSRPDKPSYRWLHLVCAARAMPHSFGPVLRETEADIAEREALWASLPEEARAATRPVAWAKGMAVTTSDGQRGEVIWYGPNKYGGGMRVGVQVGPGKDDVVWVSDADVAAVP